MKLLQEKLVTYIDEFRSKNGFGPTRKQAEMALKYTRGGIHYAVCELNRKGFLKSDRKGEKNSTCLELKKNWKTLFNKYFK